MQKKWTYKNYEIQEGLKPGSTTFRYFFVVSEKGIKKSNYCVWIKDDALSRFDQAKNFGNYSAKKPKSSKKSLDRVFCENAK